MFAMTIDQRSSRTRADGVPRLLGALAAVETVLPFERTAGDEVQGLLGSPSSVLEAAELALRAGDWSIGLGLGTIEAPLPGSVREARGPALVRARDAVDAAKKAVAVRLAVRGGPAPAAGDLEALLRLVGVTVQRRTTAQWRVIDAVRAAGDRAGAARELGITVQAISKSLLTSGEDVVRDVYPLLARLLDEADGSTT